MIALGISFAAGTFHAHPWTSLTCGEELEWPPSPWRLLHAITEGWRDGGGLERDRFVHGISSLATAPRFFLPPATAVHPRHYLPSGSADERAGLVLDAFAAIGNRQCEAFVVWDDVVLSDAERELLQHCCAHVTCLGRAESWCGLRVVDAVTDDPDLIPVDLASRVANDGPLVRRLGIDASTRGLGLLRVLSGDITMNRRERRLVPEGASWLDYRFPPAFGRDRVRRLFELRDRPFQDRCERFVLQGPAQGRQPRPLVRDTVVVAEAFRQAVMSLEGRASGGRVDPAFSGKALDGRPAQGHEHAFFLPKDLDDDGFIDHVDVWVPGSLGHDAYRTLVSVRRLYGPRLPTAEHYIVTHLGEAPRPSARRWRSATPFVLPRHEKHRGTADSPKLLDDPPSQLRAALAHHGFSGGVLPQWCRGGDARIVHRGGRATLAAEFRSGRWRESARAEAVTAVLEFATPVRGPIALGRNAHFGMGQFEPAELPANG